MASGKGTLKVELLYFDGCPSYRMAERLLREALADEGLAEPIKMIRIADDADAERLKFVGSPTIRLDGVDPFAPGAADWGMQCRVYLTPEGLRGWPTKAMLKAALKRRT